MAQNRTGIFERRLLNSKCVGNGRSCRIVRDEQTRRELSQKANQISEKANEISRSALNNTVEVQNRDKNYQDEYSAISYTDSIDSFRHQ